VSRAALSAALSAPAAPVVDPAAPVVDAAARVVDPTWDDRGTTAVGDARGAANHQEGAA